MKNINVNFNSDLAIFNIAHDFTSLQQKIWNLMFVFAFNNMDRKNEHKMSVVLISNLLNLKDLNKIKNNILQMISKDSVNNLYYNFENVRILNNLVCFSYPNYLKILLKNRLVYEIINKLLKIDFSTKYSLFLYEFCLFYYFLGWNQVILFRDFRNYLGISSSQYDSFKVFENKILIPSLFEIKNKTDFCVSIKYEKEASNIVGFKFNISCKNPLNFFEKYDYISLCKDRSLFMLQNIALLRYLRVYNAFEKLPVHQCEEGSINKNEKLLGKNNYNKEFMFQDFIAPYEWTFIEDFSKHMFSKYNKIIWTEVN